MDASEPNKPIGSAPPSGQPYIERPHGRRLVCSVARLIVLSLVTLGIAPVLAVAWFVNRMLRLFGCSPNRAFNQRVITIWARLVLLILGVHCKISGSRPVSHEACLVASNHLGYLDVFLHAAALPTSFIAMREMLHWPLIGLLARCADTVFIDRSDRTDSARACIQMRELFERGSAVTFFPEARTSPGQDVARFHAALFESVLGKESPVIAVVPATIHLALDVSSSETTCTPSELLCWWGNAPFLPHLLRLASLGRIEARLTFGTPIHPQGELAKDRTALANEVHARVCEAFVPVR